MITHYCSVGSLELLLLPKGNPWSEGHLGLKIDELDHTMQKCFHDSRVGNWQFKNKISLQPQSGEHQCLKIDIQLGVYCTFCVQYHLLSKLHTIVVWRSSGTSAVAA